MDQIVHAVRNIRAEMQIPPGINVDLFIIGDLEEAHLHLAQSNEGILRALVRVGDIRYQRQEPPLALAATSVVGTLKLLVPLPQELQEKEKIRLMKERDRLIAQDNQLRTQLSNEEFIAKAPPHLIDKLKVNLAAIEEQLAAMTKKLATLNASV